MVSALALVVAVGESAGPLLDFAAVMSAVLLGYLALLEAKRATEEARKATAEARRATVLAYQPLLAPVHDEASGVPAHGDRGQSVAFEPVRSLDAPEIEDVFRVTTPMTVQGGDPVDLRRPVVRVKNVGQGPAVLTNARIICNDGTGARLSGPLYIGSDSSELLIGDLQPMPDSDSDFSQGIPADYLPGPYATALADELWNLRSGSVFLLEVIYDDIFIDPGIQRLRALFDPRDSGRWRVLSDPLPWQREPRGTEGSEDAQASRKDDGGNS